VAPNWFVALPVPLALDLRQFSPPSGVRLFAPGDLHLTVAFLGPVTENLALAAFDAAAEFPLPPTSISFAGVKALGPARRPSAFSLCLADGRAQVEQALGAARDRICDAAGAQRDARPPLAHVTVARPRRSADPRERREAQRWAEGLVLPPMSAQLTHVSLYTWVEARSGAREQNNEDRKSALFRVVRERPLHGAEP
jgi:2'-5' RNA ligase